jgi:membrane associated rhomboid family serine protease
MFPIRDENPHFLTPLVTYGIIGLNAAVWVLVQGVGGNPALASSVCELGLIPGEILGTVAPGTSFPLTPELACVVDARRAYYTVFTSMFMHGGWFHVLSNMWFLWIFGNNVEDSMGHVRFAFFYVLCGLVAAGLQVASNPGSAIPMVGASGAIGGVMGAYVLLYPRVNVHMFLWFGFFFTTVAVPAYFMLGYWFLIQVVGGLGSLQSEGGGVAFWAHVGGFAAGAALIPLFKNPKLLRRHPYHGWRRGSSSRGWQRVR